MSNRPHRRARNRRHAIVGTVRLQGHCEHVDDVIEVKAVPRAGLYCDCCEDVTKPEDMGFECTACGATLTFLGWA